MFGAYNKFDSKFHPIPEQKHKPEPRPFWEALLGAIVAVVLLFLLAQYL